MLNFPILHIGNILNNGYLNCKFLRRHNINAHLLNLDYKHVQGQPEWEETRIRGVIDHFNPDWSQHDLAGFQRPSWLYDISLSDVSLLLAKFAQEAQSNTQTASTLSLTTSYRLKFRTLAHQLSHKLRNNLKHQNTKLSNHALTSLSVAKRFINAFSSRFQHAPKAIITKNSAQYYDSLVADFSKLYPQFKPLTLNDISDWELRSTVLAPLLRHFPLIQAYGIEPIYPLLGCPGLPFICFEHGTLRDFPYEDSARGRLYALSLQKAEHVFITNADVIRSAQRLGLQNYSFVPHPVDDQLYKPGPSPLRRQLEEQHGCDYILLGPARHHWKQCPKGMETSWLKRNDILLNGVALFRAGRPAAKLLLILFEWGQEVELSKQLTRELGLADAVRWEPISSKPVMVDFYNAADVVLDQFNDGIGTFGTVVPESMACAKPVILNYKEELHRWCYPELPPALNARTPEEVAAHLTVLWDRPETRKAAGEKGKDWFANWHSPDIVASRMIEVYQSIAERLQLPLTP